MLFDGCLELTVIIVGEWVLIEIMIMHNAAAKDIFITS